MSESTKKKFYYLSLMMAVIIFGLAAHITNVKFTTYDDLNFSFGGYDLWVYLAYDHSRIAYFISGFFAQVPYMIDNFLYFKLVHIGTLIGVVLSLGLLIKVIYRNNYLSYIYMLLMIVLWQNSHGHNLMVAYFFYMGLGIITFSFSYLFFILFLRNKKKHYIWFSLIFWAITLQGTEFWVMYLPFFLLIAYSESLQTTFKQRIAESINVSKWHIAMVLLNVLVYSVFRMYADGTYGGSVINLEAWKIVATWATYSFGLFPGYQFYLNSKVTGVFYLLKLIDFQIIVITFIVLALLIHFKNKMKEITLSTYGFIYALLIAIYGMFAPTFLISLTTKYQYWVSYHHVSDYLYSSFSFFAIALIFLLFLVKTASNKIYFFLAIVISLLVFVTQLNNKYIGDIQARNSEKLFLLDAVLESKFIQNQQEGYAISAPTLWDTAVITEKDMLSTYAEKKIGKKLKILKEGEANATLTYVKSEKNKASFLMYSENRELKAIFTFTQQCNERKPCYLMSTGTVENDNLIDNNAFVQDNALEIKVDELARGAESKSINMFELNNPINARRMLALLEYNPKPFLVPTIEYDEGFYSLESDQGQKWRWASGNSKITVKSLSNKKVAIKLVVEPASKMKMKFRVGDTSKEVVFNDTVPQTVTLLTELNKGENIIEIMPDVSPVRLSPADSRTFSFRVFELKLTGGKDSQTSKKD